MESHLPRRRKANANAIDITWISCRGVRSTVPFRAPSLHASVRVSSSSEDESQTAAGLHAHQRVTTAADGDGGENPEWNAPLRLYLPERAAGVQEESEGALLVTFEIREELPLLGDVLAASASVPVADLAAAGSSGQSSYQLTAADGKNPNGVVSFSYALQGDLAMPPAPSTVETAAASWLPYQGIHWSSVEQVGAYPPLAVAAEASVLMYPPPVREAACCFTVAEQVAVYPPLPGAACAVYPPTGASESYFPPPPWASPWSDQC